MTHPKLTVDLWLVAVLAFAALGASAAAFGGILGRVAGGILVLAVIHALNREVA